MKLNTPMKSFQPNSSRFSPILALTLLSLAGTSLSVTAATFNWTGAASGGGFGDAASWTDAANSSSHLVPGSADTAQIITGGGTNTVTISAADTLSLAQLTMNPSNTGSSAGIINQTGGLLTVGNFQGGTTGASKTFTYNISGGALNVTGSMNFGSGNSTAPNGVGSGFVVTGGTVNYTGASNIFLGSYSPSRSYIKVDGGVFNIAPSADMWVMLGGIGGGVGDITVASGTFNYNDRSNGQFYLGYANNSTGTLNVGGGLATFNTNGIYVGAATSSTGAIAVTGGTAQFTGGGSISVASGGQSKGAVTVAGGVLSLKTDNSSFSLASGGTSTGTIDVSAGSASITSAGVTAIAGGQNSTANINVTGGSLTMNNGGNDVYVGGNAGNSNTGAVANINVSNSVFNYTGTGKISFGASAGNTGNLTIGANGVFNATSAANLYVGNGSTSAAGGSGSITLSSNGQLNTNILVLGQYGNGSGTLTMGDTSSVNVNELVVGCYNGASPAYGVINLNGGTITASSIRKGATSTDSDATHNVLNANGGKIVATAGASPLIGGLYVNLLSGGLTVDTNGNDKSITSSLQGVGGFTKTGAGTLTLTGAHTYSGDTTISAGRFDMNGSLGAGSAVSVGSGATLGGSGSVNGHVTVTSGTINGSNLTLAGVSFGGNSTLAGTTSASNIGVTNGVTTISGNTTVANGVNVAATSTLIVGGSVDGDVSVSGVLGGNGSITGVTTINSGGVLAPGVGNINTGDLIISLGGVFDIQFGVGVNGMASATGGVNVDGGDLHLSLATGVTGSLANGIYFLINNDDVDVISGTFSKLNGVATSLGQGDRFVWNSQEWEISYTADAATSSLTGGNDLAFIAVPEPSTWAMMVGGIGLLAFLQRRHVGHNEKRA